MTYYLFHECGEFIDYFDDHAEAVSRAKNHCITNRGDFLVVAKETDYIGAT